MQTRILVVQAIAATSWYINANPTEYSKILCCGVAFFIMFAVYDYLSNMAELATWDSPGAHGMRHPEQ
jgi:arginine exporter protein ArgO